MEICNICINSRTIDFEGWKEPCYIDGEEDAIERFFRLGGDICFDSPMEVVAMCLSPILYECSMLLLYDKENTIVGVLTSVLDNDSDYGGDYYEVQVHVLSEYRSDWESYFNSFDISNVNDDYLTVTEGTGMEKQAVMSFCLESDSIIKDPYWVRIEDKDIPVVREFYDWCNSTARGCMLERNIGLFLSFRERKDLYIHKNYNNIVTAFALVDSRCSSCVPPQYEVSFVVAKKDMYSFKVTLLELFEKYGEVNIFRNGYFEEE